MGPVGIISRRMDLYTVCELHCDLEDARQCSVKRVSFLARFMYPRPSRITLRPLKCMPQVLTAQHPPVAYPRLVHQEKLCHLDLALLAVIHHREKNLHPPGILPGRAALACIIGRS